MKFEFDAVVISTKKQESKGKEYYRVNLEQDGEIVTLECLPDVAKQVGENKYQPYHLQGVYIKGEYEGRVFLRMTVVGARIAKG